MCHSVDWQPVSQWSHSRERDEARLPDHAYRTMAQRKQGSCKQNIPYRTYTAEKRYFFVMVYNKLYDSESLERVKGIEPSS